MTVLANMQSDTTVYPAVSIFNRFAFYLNGIDIPFYRDANNSFTWMHQTPVEIPTEDHSGAGSMSATNGGYKYRISEYNILTAEGHNANYPGTADISFLGISPIVPGTGHETALSGTSTITGNFTNKQVVITVGATALNSEATHKLIYGTKDGGNIYYYLGSVAVGTTTFTDNNITRTSGFEAGAVTTLSDGSQTQEEYNVFVRNYVYSVATKERIVVGGVKKYTTGTVAVTNGNATVTGTGTAWTRAMISDFFQVSGDTQKYEILAVGGATSITLNRNYAGSTDSGLSYEIGGYTNKIMWSAKDPTTARPMWWAYPQSHYRFLIDSDRSEIMGINKMGNTPVVFKQYSYSLLTENGNDFIPRKSKTPIGTCSHHSIAESGTGSLIFMSYDGQMWEANGTTARNLDIDLSKTIDGINKTRLPYVQAAYYGDKNWYLLLYTSESGTMHDRMLIIDLNINQWLIWKIEGNCVGLVKGTESGQTVFKPWIGSEGKFLYKLLTGNNLGAGTSGTLSGTITAIDSTNYLYFDDSAASFYQTDDGHKDIYAALYDTNDDFLEEQRVASNTGTRITVAAAFDSANLVTGNSYYLGDLRWFWESKVFNLGSDKQKTVYDVLLYYKKVSTTTNVKIKFYFSQDADMVGDSASSTKTFDLSQNYYEPLTLPDNYARFYKYRIQGHGNATPATVHGINFNEEIWSS